MAGLLDMAGHALDLIQRPGNMIRAGLARGPQAMMPALQGQIHVDPTELPFVKGLPDQGPQIGPLHLTPKTAVGFAAGMGLDPLSYILPEMMASGPLASMGAKAASLGPFGVFAANNIDDVAAALARQGQHDDDEADKPDARTPLDPRVMSRRYQPTGRSDGNSGSFFNAPPGYGV